MTKEEFINGLSEALAHTAAREVIIRNIEFYRSYIDGEIAKGRSEREVMDELGDPRLIANSRRQIGRASCRKECRSRWSPYH